MILEQKITMKWNPYNRKLYEYKGYQFTQYGEEFEIDVNDLSNNSRAFVFVRCDYCGEIFQTEKRNYYSGVIKQNKKACCLKQECIQQKKIETCREKYGVDYIGQNLEVMEKMKQTRIEKYGVSWAQQNKEIRQKSNQSLYENGNTACSKQQLYLCDLLGGELNYPIDNCNVDILYKDNIIIEYNGSGHNLNVHAKVITQEEFDAKERKRDYFLKSQGYKIIKIISPRDYLPKDDKLTKSLIEKAIKWMDENNRHHYNIEFSDKSIDPTYGQMKSLRIRKKKIA